MRQVALLLLCALTLAGCSKKEAETRSNASKPGNSVILSTTVARNSAFSMAIAFDPSPPKMSSKTKFHVDLKDSSGAPVDGTDVRISLVMPLMDMGKNEVVMQPAGKGAYDGTGQFSMSGEWEVVVTASAAGKSGKTTFNVRVED